MKGLTFDDLFPSRFLKASMFQGRPVTLTISDVSVEGLEREDGVEHQAAIITFKETKKQLVCNRTNGESIKAMFGADVDNWLGKRITLRPENDPSGLSESGLAIRLSGSPDLKQPIEALIKLPRRKPQKRKLVPTKTGANEPMFDTDTGEVETPDLDARYGETMPAFEEL